MFIMAILVGLAVSVGQYVINQAAVKETRATQRIVHVAIDTYYEVEGEVPIVRDGNRILNKAPCYRFLALLVKYDRVRKKLASLKPETFGPQGQSGSSGQGEEDEDRSIYDGWDNPMEYQYSGGLGGRPVLISGGPDGNLTTSKDNIRSDE